MKILKLLFEPNCYKRKCIHYIGISQPDGTEMTEVNVCKIFPKGIPHKITYKKIFYCKKYQPTKQQKQKGDNHEKSRKTCY